MSITEGRLPRLLTPEQVANFLNTTRKAIYMMNDRAQLPKPLRVGRRLLFAESDLLHWLREKSAPSLERK